LASSQYRVFHKYGEKTCRLNLRAGHAQNAGYWSAPVVPHYQHPQVENATRCNICLNDAREYYKVSKQKMQNKMASRVHGPQSAFGHGELKTSWLLPITDPIAQYIGGLDGLGSIPRKGMRFFFYLTASRPTLGTTQPPIKWVPGSLSQGVKWPELEDDHLPPSNAQIKNFLRGSGSGTGSAQPREDN
jgi:hypothetical protein